MDLTLWLPLTFFLGVASITLMFWFARACDKV
jgi:hypothetical protein